MEEEAVSLPIRRRLADLQELLTHLHDMKQEQGVSGQPAPGRAIWLSPALWREVIRQLESQMHEIVNWERLLVAAKQENLAEQSKLAEMASMLTRTQEVGSTTIEALENNIDELRAEGAQKQREWDMHKKELQDQADHMLELVHEREGEVAAVPQLTRDLKASNSDKVREAARADAAEAKVAELQAKLDYVNAKTNGAVGMRDEMSAQIRRLDVALAESHSQNEALRRQLAARQMPDAQLLSDAKRFKADNERLVALLQEAKEWRSMAAELAHADGLHYIPVQEALVAKGMLDHQYSPLLDRALRLELAKSGSRAKGAKLTRGGSKEGAGDECECDDDGPEQWSWVPVQAVNAAMRAIAQGSINGGAFSSPSPGLSNAALLVTRISVPLTSGGMPTAPIQPLLNLLLELNKIWRKREADKLATIFAAHETEVRELHELYRQRAPYEAVVGRTRLVDLKRQLRLQVEHAKHLESKAAARDVRSVDDTKITLQLGLDSVNTLSKEVKKLHRRNTTLTKSLKQIKTEPPVCNQCLDTMLKEAQALGAGLEGLRESGTRAGTLLEGARLWGSSAVAMAPAHAPAVAAAAARASTRAAHAPPSGVDQGVARVTAAVGGGAGSGAATTVASVPAAAAAPPPVMRFPRQDVY
ncbi:hypothetical protein FOA52_003655 [Chlamydomonas sp. UWO 241]|nr:hypothetical protein FOA52_003655 [Chlamydomonas sp. UWO 241]